MSCTHHIIGVCAGSNIVSFDDPKVKDFLRKVQVFTTSKKQVNHPGFMLLSKYCTECGLKVDYDKNKSQWDELIEASISREKL